MALRGRPRGRGMAAAPPPIKRRDAAFFSALLESQHVDEDSRAEPLAHFDDLYVGAGEDREPFLARHREALEAERVDEVLIVEGDAAIELGVLAELFVR